LCDKKDVRYASSSYEFCGGDHEDTPEKQEECWDNQPKKRRNASTQIMTTMENGGVAEIVTQNTSDSIAETVRSLWKPRYVSQNDENLIHVVGDQEHEFCDECYTKNY
jgi:hypothetical protein